MANTLGFTIQKLRKERRITQEALAKAVNVSTQAVSKWENGGSPDIEILPMIADFFHVSIDYLFGRSNAELTDLDELIRLELLSLNDKKQMDRAIELCLAIQKGLSNYQAMNDLLNNEQVLKMENKYSDTFFYIEKDAGFSYLKLVENQNYFVLFPEPEKSYRSLVPTIEEACELFSLLAQPDYLKVLYYLYSRNCGFTLSLLCEKCNISKQKANEIMQTFIEKEWVDSRKVEMGKEMMDTYFLMERSAFIVMLASMKRLLNTEITAVVGYNDREKPFL